MNRFLQAALLGLAGWTLLSSSPAMAVPVNYSFNFGSFFCGSFTPNANTSCIEVCLVGPGNTLEPAFDITTASGVIPTGTVVSGSGGPLGGCFTPDFTESFNVCCPSNVPFSGTNELAGSPHAVGGTTALTFSPANINTSAASNSIGEFVTVQTGDGTQVASFNVATPALPEPPMLPMVMALVSLTVVRKFIQ